MNKINQQTKWKHCHRYREQTESRQKGVGLGDRVQNLKRVSRNKQTSNLVDTDSSTVIVRGKGECGEGGEGRGGINAVGRRLDFGS